MKLPSINKQSQSVVAENQNLTISAQSSEYRVNRSVLNSGRRAQTKLERRDVDNVNQNLSMLEMKEQAKLSNS